MTTFETGYRAILSDKLDPAVTSMKVSVAPTVTEGRLYLKSWSQEEWIGFTGVSWTTLTGLTRQLSQTADPSVSLWNWYTWIAWSKVKLVAMHDQMPNKQASNNTFEWDVSVWWDIKTQWDILVDKADFKIQEINSNFRIRRDGNSMKFRDDETAEVSLKTLATAGWADQYVSSSATDTTAWHLDTKLTVDTGLKVSTVNPWASESRKVEIDTTDTDVFVKTSSGAGDKNKVPILNASGQIADGFINTTTIEWVSTISLTAWEDITENQAIRKWVAFTYNSKIENITWTDRIDNEDMIWVNTSYRAVWQSFTISWWPKLLRKLKAKIWKNNAPNWNLTAYLYSDTWTTLVATSTNTIEETSLSSSGSYQTFNFSNISLTDWVYYFKISTSRLDDWSNYSYWIKFDWWTTYSWWVGYTINSSNTWTAIFAWWAGADRAFSIEFSIPEDTTKAYLTDAKQSEEIDFIWFAAESKNIWETVKVQVVWVKWWFTSKTSMATQYLSDTPWAISESAWTNSKKIGKALTTTQVKIVDIPL